MMPQNLFQGTLVSRLEPVYEGLHRCLHYIGQSSLHRSDHGQKLNKMALGLRLGDTRNILHCFVLIVIDYLVIAMQISFRRTNTHSGTEPVDSVAHRRPYILTWCGIRVQRATNIPYIFYIYY